MPLKMDNGHFNKLGIELELMQSCKFFVFPLSSRLPVDEKYHELLHYNYDLLPVCEDNQA